MERVGGPDARLGELHWLAGNGELPQVVANHLRLDSHLVGGIAVVDTTQLHAIPARQEHPSLLAPLRGRCLLPRAGASASRAAPSRGPRAPSPGATQPQRP